MSDPKKPTAPISGIVDDPASIPLPKLGPPSTGNLFMDSLRSAYHIGEVPCARSSFLTGIASGVGIGVIRGISASAFVAANWAMGTFVSIAVSTYTICYFKMQKQHQLTRAAIQNLPKQLQSKESGKEKPTST